MTCELSTKRNDQQVSQVHTLCNQNSWKIFKFHFQQPQIVLCLITIFISRLSEKTLFIWYLKKVFFFLFLAFFVMKRNCWKIFFFLLLQPALVFVALKIKKTFLFCIFSLSRAKKKEKKFPHTPRWLSGS